MEGIDQRSSGSASTAICVSGRPPEIVGEFVENCVADTLSSDVVIEGVMNANTEISHGDPFKAEARISRSIVTQPELRCGGREPTRR